MTDETHTSTPRPDGGSNTGVAGAQLRAIIERIERLEEEKKALAEDIRDIFAEAKGNGYDVKTLRQVVRLRKRDSSERTEQEDLLHLYLNAIGDDAGIGF